MAQLIVRNLEESIKRRLAARAKKHGNSMEEEARLILREAVQRQPSSKREGLATLLANRFSDVPAEFRVEEIRGSRLRIPEFGE